MRRSGACSYPRPRWTISSDGPRPADGGRVQAVRHGTGQQGTFEARTASAPRQVPRRQKPGRVRARRAAGPRLRTPVRRIWCSTARPAGARPTSRWGWA